MEILAVVAVVVVVYLSCVVAEAKVVQVDQAAVVRQDLTTAITLVGSKS